jgi:hypothetical protein
MAENPRRKPVPRSSGTRKKEKKKLQNPLIKKEYQLIVEQTGEDESVLINLLKERLGEYATEANLKIVLKMIENTGGFK